MRSKPVQGDWRDRAAVFMSDPTGGRTWPSVVCDAYGTSFKETGLELVSFGFSAPRESRAQPASVNSTLTGLLGAIATSSARWFPPGQSWPIIRSRKVRKSLRTRCWSVQGFRERFAYVCHRWFAFSKVSRAVNCVAKFRGKIQIVWNARFLRTRNDFSVQKEWKCSRIMT